MSEPSSQSEPARAGGPRYQPLVIVLAALAAGIAVDRWFAVGLGAWWATGATAWIGWLVRWRRRADGTAAAALLVAVGACGGAWHHLRWHRFAQDDLGYFARFADQPACVEAMALVGPRRLPAPPRSPLRVFPTTDRTRLELEVVGLRDGAEWRRASGRARLIVDGELGGVCAGDRLRVFAQLSAPRPAQNPGQFDFGLHARGDRRRSHLRCAFPECVHVLEPAGVWRPALWIDQVRTRAHRLLADSLEERHARLAAAVLLGVREEVGQDQIEAFMQTGTVHVLSISGMHVGIVAWAVLMLMRLLWVPRNASAAVVCLATTFYAWITDAEPPAVRAAILVLAAGMAYSLGRRALSFNALAAAGLIVLAQNPADLFRTGVQLSFLCVAGLMWFAPRLTASGTGVDALTRLSRRAQPWPRRLVGVSVRWAWELTLLGMVLWALTIPLVMARFHLFSPVALVLNTILWIPMTLALVSGFGLLATGWLVPPLGAWCAWCCNHTLWLLEASIEFFRRVPATNFATYRWVPGPDDWWLWGFYGGLGALALVPAIRPPRRWCAAILAGWVGLGFAASWLHFEKPSLRCTFLSVDHGSATVLELPSGATVLCDAGQFASPDGATQAIASYLWSRGITTIEAVFLSHPDMDHCNALPGLLERFSIRTIYVPPGMFERPRFERPRQVDRALYGSIQRAGVPIEEVYGGRKFGDRAGCTIEVRHPPRGGIVGSENANSLVLGVEYQGCRILLPGDLEPPGLEDVTSEEPWDCDVLLAPHHGGRNSRHKDLAAWCSPEHIVISAGLRRGLEEVKAELERSGGRVLHTGELGAIRVTLDAQGVRVLPARLARLAPGADQPLQ